MILISIRPTSVAQLMTGDEELCSIPTGSSNILDNEVFSMVIHSLPLTQEGQLSVSGERVCTSIGLPLRGLSLHRKVCVYSR